MAIQNENKPAISRVKTQRRADDRMLEISENCDKALIMENALLHAGVEARNLAAGIERQCELDECNKRLMEASWTRADFLANMSKELRTPLHSIIGFSNILQDQLTEVLDVKQSEYLNNILSSSKHLLHMINDVLDLSMIEAGSMELEPSAVSIRELLEDSITMLGKKAHKDGKKIQLNLAADADVKIIADKRRLKQILFNLISNAIKYTDSDGVIDVCAVIDGDFIEITVGDTGIGIKGEDVSKIFNAFTQLEPAMSKKFEGIGLGLALSRQLVEMHGGRIWFKSLFGTGSRFSFTIPRTWSVVQDPGKYQQEFMR
jgi:signal transduction histidine kinase